MLILSVNKGTADVLRQQYIITLYLFWFMNIILSKLRIKLTQQLYLTLLLPSLNRS